MNVNVQASLFQTHTLMELFDKNPQELLSFNINKNDENPRVPKKCVYVYIY